MRLYMLIDDVDVFNKVHGKVISLADPDASVTCFLSSVEALNYLKEAIRQQETPDFIFLDINMPEINGFELLDQLKELYPAETDALQVYMLTSSLDERDVLRSEGYAAIKGYYSKPLTKDIIQSLIE